MIEIFIVRSRCKVYIYNLWLVYWNLPEEYRSQSNWLDRHLSSQDFADFFSAYLSWVSYDCPQTQLPGFKIFHFMRYWPLSPQLSGNQEPNVEQANFQPKMSLCPSEQFLGKSKPSERADFPWQKNRVKHLESTLNAHLHANRCSAWICGICRRSAGRRKRVGGHVRGSPPIVNIKVSKLPTLVLTGWHLNFGDLQCNQRQLRKK